VTSTQLEAMARAYVRENRLTLGEKLLLSHFVCRVKGQLQEQELGDEVVGDFQRGWVIRGG